MNLIQLFLFNYERNLICNSENNYMVSQEYSILEKRDFMDSPQIPFLQLAEAAN